MNFRIENFYPDNSSEELWKKYFGYIEELFKEENPKDQLPSREITKTSILDPYPYSEIRRYLIFINDTEDIIGSGRFQWLKENSPEFETNKHILDGYLSIKKDFRRQGLGKSLLTHMIAKINVERLTTFQTGSTFQFGHSFLEKLGGTVSFHALENRLYFEDINWELVNQWVNEGHKRAIGVTLEEFNTIPKKYLEEYCVLLTETLNQAPQDDLEGRANVTPELYETYEQKEMNKGFIFNNLISKESNNDISGLTTMLYNSKEPHILRQMMTGVRDKYRGRGIGKWLKGQMLLLMYEKYPHTSYITTGNADANAPMLSINERLGFKKCKSWTGYKFKIKDLKQILLEQ
ncbi:MAG: GNAT family N-acetyltransferase [Candidatus Hodarchaeales archaeon]|jgi:GNAT superfamily N-acetyltransferase